MFRSLTTFEDDEDDDDSRNPFFMINSMPKSDHCHPATRWMTRSTLNEVEVDDEVDVDDEVKDEIDDPMYSVMG